MSESGNDRTPAGEGGARSKVFGIGFHKTGTKSLGAALRILGYRVVGPVGTRDPDIARNALATARALSFRYDAFQDNPWPILFREMDALHPGSRFILTTRPEDEWIASVKRYFGEQASPMRGWIYGAGSPAGNEAVYLRRYREHHDHVRAWFRDRPGDLLEMDITRGDGWERLCPFLGVPVPDTPFPAENRSPRPV